MPKRSRDRQLAKLAARRHAERDAARRRRRLVTAVAVAALLIVGLIVAAGTLLADDAPADPAASAGPSSAAGTPPPMTIDPSTLYTASFETSMGTFQVRLLADAAPEAVNNFVSLARDGFYDGLTWHRIVEGFVIQGGDPQGDGMGGPGYELPVTVTEGVSFDAKGVVAYAHAASGGNGSQFFITLAPSPALDPPQGEYTIFGEVSKGMDVVEAIGAVPTEPGPACPPEESCQPVEPVTIDTVTIRES